MRGPRPQPHAGQSGEPGLEVLAQRVLVLLQGGQPRQQPLPAGALRRGQPREDVDGGALRIGLAPSVDDTDVDRLLAGLADFLRR